MIERPVYDPGFKTVNHMTNRIFMRLKIRKQRFKYSCKIMYSNTHNTIRLLMSVDLKYGLLILQRTFTTIVQFTSLHNCMPIPIAPDPIRV